MAGETSTIINIHHVDVLNVGAQLGCAKALAAEIGRGVDPAALHDIDPSISPETPDSPTDGLTCSIQEDLDAIEGALDQGEEIRAERFVPVEERIKPYTRKAHLIKAMKTAARLRRITGAVTTYKETTLKDIDSAEDALESYTENFAASLDRACGHCAFKGSCRFEGKPDKWLDAHPTGKGDVERKHDQESMERFKEDLGTDPMAHCIPTRNRFHQDRQGVLPKREL
jgi:hypothetical protein